MSECALLAALVILKRRVDLDWPGRIRDALEQCELTWTGFFNTELRELGRENHRSLTGRNRYRDTVYDFVTFNRNRLVHRGNIDQVAQGIRDFCDPLDAVSRALELSQDPQVVSTIGAIRQLKLATLTFEENLQHFQ
jgi:hypothetical protein